LQAGLGALADEAALEFRHCPEHLQDEHAAGAGGVDRVGERAEMRPLGAQPVDHRQQMRE
jgi:hypothetical protein